MHTHIGELSGLHHVSALSAQIGRSHAFYTGVLGLRPVITTVNQDDPRMYHLFYSDGAGSPGSEMTVFDLPHAAPERRGNNSITRTTFRVAGETAMALWAERLAAHQVAHGGVLLRDGRLTLEFADTEGTQLALIDDGGAGAAVPWEASPVAPAQQIRGLGYSEITVPALEPTERFLVEGLGMRRERSYQLDTVARPQVLVYAMGEGGAHAEIHVNVSPTLPRARYGAGGVHHVALRVPEGQSIGAWAERLSGLGYRNTGIVDRHYFRSVYVREPNGVLFELATDGPGFEVDGPIEEGRLTLPPSLEPRRAAIEAQLKPLPAASA
jgi:glyoxalase family protein